MKISTESHFMCRSRGHHCNGRQAGLSLIELMVGLAILGILLGLAAPSLQGIVLSSRVNTQVNDLVGAINLARSEAVKINSGVTICKSTDGASCATTGTDWATGWIVFTDANYNGTVDAGETIIRAFPAMSGSLTAVANAGMANNIIFSGLGHPSATFVGGRTSICPPASANQAYCRTICVNSQGRPRVDTPAQLTADTLCGN